MLSPEKIAVTGSKRPKGYSDAEILADLKAIAAELERLFGPAVDEYMIDWVDFVNANLPCISYPPGNETTAFRRIRIQVVGQALADRAYVLYQLAHELVHCLAPDGTSSATRFEEGVATWFQEYYNKRFVRANIVIGDSQYSKVCDVVRKTLGDVPVKVARLRKTEPRMSLWKDDVFSRIGLHLKRQDRRYLLKRFGN